MSAKEDRPYFPNSCPITLAGIVASIALVGFAVFVIVSDLVIG